MLEKHNNPLGFRGLIPKIYLGEQEKPPGLCRLYGYMYHHINIAPRVILCNDCCKIGFGGIQCIWTTGTNIVPYLILPYLILVIKVNNHNAYLRNPSHSHKHRNVHYDINVFISISCLSHKQVLYFLYVIDCYLYMNLLDYLYQAVYAKEIIVKLYHSTCLGHSQNTQ